MILDWKKYCEEVYKTKKIRRDDPSDNKSVFSQESHYLKYLILQNLSKEEIFQEWLKIKNGMASAFKDDIELQRVSFFKIYKSASNLPDDIYDRDYKSVHIYKSEITFLNKIKAPKWVKQYWLAMLIYWKFAIQYTKKVRIDATLCNWAMRQTDLKDTLYSHHQEKIAQFNSYEPQHFVIKSLINPNGGERYYKMDWSVEKAQENSYEVKNLSLIKKFTKSLVNNKEICPMCGREYEKTSHQKTSLCSSCYLKTRAEKENERSKKNYRKKILL